MKQRKAPDVSSKGAGRKHKGNFARSAVLLSALAAASFGCVMNDTKRPAGHSENNRNRFSSDVWLQEVREGGPALAELPAVQERPETIELNSAKKISVVTFPGNYVSLMTRCEFGTGELMTVSDGIKAHVSVASYKIKVRGIDRAGAEFELHEERLLGLMAADKMDITLDPEERMELSNRKSTELLAIFRVNFDGTKTAGIKSIEELGVRNFRVEPAEENGVRVIYTIPADE